MAGLSGTNSTTPKPLWWVTVTQGSADSLTAESDLMGSNPGPPDARTQIFTTVGWQHIRFQRSGLGSIPDSVSTAPRRAHQDRVERGQAHVHTAEEQGTPSRWGEVLRSTHWELLFWVQVHLSLFLFKFYSEGMFISLRCVLRTGVRDRCPQSTVDL